MFNGSSNIIIQGGTFIVVSGNTDSASLSKALGLNISQNPELESNDISNPKFCASLDQGSSTAQVGPASGSHCAEISETPVHASRRVPEDGLHLKNGPTTDQLSLRNPSQEANLQIDPASGSPAEHFGTSIHTPRQVLKDGPTTDQFSDRNPSREANAPEFYKPQVDPASRSHSAENFVHGSGRVPERGLYLMQGPTTDQFSHRKPSREANAQEFCKSRFHSVENSVHGSRRVPDHGSYLMPTPSVSSEVQSWDKKINPSDNSQAPPPFPVATYAPKPQYAVHALSLNKFQRRHPTFFQPEHFQFGAGRRSCRPTKAYTYPFPTPSPPFPVPQLVCSSH